MGLSALSGYNAGQKEAILHRDGPCLVLAGPGSGKTTVITRRLKTMIESHNIPPQGILVVTFTKAAATEMQLRFESLMGRSLPVSFGTFHAIFYRMLREREPDDPPRLMSEKDKKDILTRLIRKYSLPLKAYSGIDNIITSIKNIKKIPDSEFTEFDRQTISRLFQDYRAVCRENRVIDFDDMAYECLCLFHEEPSFLQKWRSAFTHILVDEYQDIAPAQELVVKALCAPYHNLFVVGDDDQAIYGFRGAGTGLMLGFEGRYPGAKRIVLDVNYRCRPGIIEAGKKLIRSNEKRFDKQQNPNREPSENPSKEVIIKGFTTREEQDTELIERLRTLSSKGELSKAALLYRKNNDCDRMAKLLEKSRIPCIRIKKEPGLTTSFVAEDIIAYLRLIEGDYTRNNFFKIMNRPDRGIDRQGVDSVDDRVSFEAIARTHSYDKGVGISLGKLAADIERAGTLSIYGRIMYIRKQMGYETFLRESFKGLALEDKLQILGAIQELSGEAQSIDRLNELMTLGVKNKRKENDEEDGVRIMTFHGSKGLEFDYVFLPDLNEGTVPNQKVLTPENEEEERRMLYVAMTRARERLYMSYVKGTRREPVAASRFLKDFI